MKILYNDKITATEAQRRLENAKPSADNMVWIEKKNGKLYLKLNGFRMSTTFKLGFPEEYLVLKYSGFDSYMNIIICSLWCGSFIAAVLACVILSFITQSWEIEILPGILMAGLLSFGFLWSLVLKYRLKARKYVYKILGIKVDK